MAYVYSARSSNTVSYFDGLLPTEQLNEVGLAYPDDITKASLFFLSHSKRFPSIANWYNLSLGIPFQHWNLERFNVSYIRLEKVTQLMYIQSWIQANSCYSRWSDISSTSPIPVGTDFKDTDRICIPYVLSTSFGTFKSYLVSVQTRKSDSLSWSIPQFWYSWVLR